MKRKILIVSILAVFMLVAVSFATAVNTEKTEEKEESPLYNYRTNKAIQEKIQNIKTKFFGDRLFFLPFQWLRDNNQNLREKLNQKFTVDSSTCSNFDTCGGMPTTACGPLCTYGRITIICGGCTQGIACDGEFTKGLFCGNTLDPDNCWN